jgi:hypothetical protein
MTDQIVTRLDADSAQPYGTWLHIVHSERSTPGLALAGGLYG